MLSFLGRRLVRAVITVFGVLTIAFVIVRLNGSPAQLMLGPDATPENIVAFDRAYGFDRSIPEQLLTFVGNGLQGDFGESIRFGRPSVELVLDQLPSTLLLAGSAFLFGLLLAFVLTLVVELYGGRRLRNAVLWIGALVQAVPTFLLGVLAILVFAIWLKLLPALGADGPTSLILPAVTLGLFEVALYVRLFAVSFDEQRSLDYVRTAYSKGQSRRAVVLHHMLPNAALPLLTVAGINLGQLIGGTVVIETVFNWPGAGQLIYQAVSAKDYPVVQAGVVVIAALFVLINLVVDLLYAVLDPRVRLS
ncbi:MAG TPA: ABC transporter permease [Mycobacteriales bacterium]|nr:ABC transporter permease [Mycobacteriales bacterium]